MARKHLVLTLLLLVLSLSFNSGCGSGSANVTPTPDPSIVWADDFEDGDYEGWEEDDPGWYVKEGVLTSGPDSANPIIHESNVALVALNTITDGTFRSPAAEADLGKKLTGWNHFDITRDASGNSKIYLDGELVLEYKDDVTISPQLFFLDVEDLGLAFDNLVVRDQVIAIQP
jgi:hypothetical protein